ncbi:beta-lactamase family [Pyrenophora seminiperda CCB06]|uniref:Beta-lactamase family n=1 Tax=Pyrenophora seminiperda CCB06 TaxID=1302712 RepID=A0A3M7LY75_9PLEO|nr:beta-lactamase family [Pyrenophora seminiperda CCB06]
MNTRERNASRPDIPQVNGDALYRIASITKTFTVLGILYQHAAGNLSLDETANMYLKELGDKSDGGIPWKDITLRSLASQLSGIPREWAQGDIINQHFDPTDVGLPPDVSREGLPACDEYSPNYETICTAKGSVSNSSRVTQLCVDLFKQIKKFRPLFAPNQASTYSNLAYEILGLVIWRVRNQTYESYINDAIFSPLNMFTTTFSLPPDSAGVIPAGDQFWDVNEGVQNPTGGIYSSSKDLSKYLRYVLTHFNAITPAINWIHPVSPSRGLNSFYGMPWEIFQTDRILKNSKRTVRFITKSGGLPGYTSIIMTVPEYDMGITILVAGPSEIFSALREIVTVTMTQAAEKLASRQLDKRYAGTYRAAGSKLNSTVTLKVNHHGLVLTNWISNGTDLYQTSLYKAMMPPRSFLQLVPTLLYRNETKSEGEEWRAMIVEGRDEGVGAIWDDFCIEDYDTSSYAGIPFNEAVFWDKRDDGSFGTLELSAFRVNLTRVDHDQGESEHGGQETMEL